MRAIVDEDDFGGKGQLVENHRKSMMEREQVLLLVEQGHNDAQVGTARAMSRVGLHERTLPGAARRCLLSRLRRTLPRVGSSDKPKFEGRSVPSGMDAAKGDGESRVRYMRERSSQAENWLTRPRWLK